MKFTRQIPPVKYSNYRRYRQFTRRDFQNVCAHCFLHEDEVGGEEDFVQDHFEPKHRPNVDPADYLNLYWSCWACNSRSNKGGIWPSPEQMQNGERFCDPCDIDPVDHDYREEDDYCLKPLSSAGKYTILHIRLNERPSLTTKRRIRKETRERYRESLTRLRVSLEEWSAKIEQSGDMLGREKCDQLAGLVEAYQEFVNREPFMLSSLPPEIPQGLISGI